jgi:wobble nucleotide-excising tRNase
MSEPTTEAPPTLDPRLAAMLEELQPEITRQVREKSAEKVVSTMYWSIEHAVKEACDKYIADEVVPAVHASMAKEKNLLVQTIIESIHAGAEGMRARIVERMIERTKDNYRMDKVVKELFGGY